MESKGWGNFTTEKSIALQVTLMSSRRKLLAFWEASRVELGRMVPSAVDSIINGVNGELPVLMGLFRQRVSTRSTM